jgi:NADP-dependent 3-hydroxy acid dehydrogenase YdfG
VATSRSVSKIQDLKSKGAHIVQLDVNEPLEKLQNSVEKEVIGVYGKVDVLVNNAGFIAVGALEENTYVSSYSL